MDIEATEQNFYAVLEERIESNSFKEWLLLANMISSMTMEAFGM